ncbi:conserved hypothetical protein [Ixodes scapularis]|uniref:PEP-utilising enzyme mobile domain-containing protein n=1 Tax=Ixodes scapularis TaxID=6945 RepID=B7PT98_IXOSC|nr:conserved hypothetical protein [Ixodes scapularis]|eukprot:XP_002404041.1 conserved hypothetical protein [Ixodes scapularis]
MFQHDEEQSMMTKGMFYGMLGRLFESKDVAAKFVERNGHPSKLTGLQMMAFLLKVYLTPEVFSDLATLLSNCKQVESADVPARLKQARSYLEQNDEEPGRLYRELIRCHGHRCIKEALLVRTVHIFRLALIKLGRKMVQEGRLPDPRLVFHLELDELRRLLDTRSAALVLKAIRRDRIHPALGQLRFPDIVRGVPCPVGSPGAEPQGPRDPSCVKGTPVSRGSVTAPARVVKTLDAADCIQPGDILVTNATDIGWSPYFPLLAGLVTELGGLLSHGAVIAREYGLPCVVGVENATDIFASGDIILLDATRGMVATIKTAAAQEDS